MNLTKHYNELYRDSICKIKKGNYQTDSLIDDPTDFRRGLTLIITPSSEVKSNFQKCISALKSIEPDQYYYPSSDIHITLLSIISCYNGFDISKISVADYIEKIEKCLINSKPIEIDYRGVTASPSCIMAQGFPVENTLNKMRNNLREEFKNSNLQHSIDKRYQLETAHSTIARFKSELKNIDHLCHRIEENRATDFGTFTANTIELVHNDWYQRQSRVTKLHTFRL